MNLDVRNPDSLPTSYGSIVFELFRYAIRETIYMSGASQWEHRLEITNDSSSFYRKIGLLKTYRQLKPLGLAINEIIAMFDESQTGMLQDFCEENPDCHIVTFTQPGRLENRFVPNNNLYMLADGDQNPDLVLDIFWKKDRHLLLEEGLDQALAMGSPVDRCHKAK